jgi:hypothetical protein
MLSRVGVVFPDEFVVADNHSSSDSIVSVVAAMA